MAAFAPKAKRFKSGGRFEAGSNAFIDLDEELMAPFLTLQPADDEEEEDADEDQEEGKDADDDQEEGEDADEDQEEEEDADEDQEEGEDEDDDELRASLSAWNQLCLPRPILMALRELNFKEPTPIQCLTIPPAMRDRLDILGAAETGSGKTLAFGIPLINYIMEDKKSDSAKKLRGLVLTPTRELAVQVKKHLEAVGKFCGVTVSVLVGGLSMQKQERVLRKLQPDIVVATPGRLWEVMEQTEQDHLSREVVSKLGFLVIDEADRMTEKGHFEEVLKVVELMKYRGEDTKRQVLIFSATLTLIHETPKRLKLAKKRKRKDTQMTVDSKMKTLMSMLGMREEKSKVVDLTTQGVGRPSQEYLKETKISCVRDEKDLYLYYFLSTYPGRALVFCNSKDCLRRLVNVLKNLNLKPLALHAGMEQKKRLIALEKYTANPRSLLVASDVAARGLDIMDIEHVIHYQVPRTAEIYVHRSGRTARAMTKGLTLLLCEPGEAYFYKKLCFALNDGNDFSSFPIDEAILKVVRNRVELAQEVDKLEHKLKKSKVKTDWFMKAAQMADIEVDERADLFAGEDDLQKQSEGKRLKGMKKMLGNMLKAKIVPRSCYTSHVTKSGSLNLPLIGGQTAIEVIESKNSAEPVGENGFEAKKRKQDDKQAKMRAKKERKRTKSRRK